MGLILVLYYVPIVVATGLCFLAGWAWYHPALFGAKWAAEQSHRKMPDDFQAGMTPALIASTLDSLLTSTLTITLFVMLGWSGVVVFALLMVSGSFASNCFKGGSVSLWYIDVGYILLRLAIAMMVLTAYFKLYSG